MALVSQVIKILGASEKETPKEQYFYGLVEKSVLVTGAYGQLGNEIRLISESENMPFRFYFTDSDLLDITNRVQVEEFVRINNIRYIVNCAAYTAVDKAETEKDKAFEINVTGVANIAEVAKMYDAKVIHISTDYVFDGCANTPYKENMSTNPLSVYGDTKLKGEQLLQSILKDCIIIRTSWLYSEFGSNFVKSMISLMNSRDLLNVVEDEKGSPTYAADLAEMIIHILKFSEENEWISGIYHFANEGEVTRFDFAKEIKRVAGIDNCEIMPIKSAEYGSVVKRPAYSALDTSKISYTFKVEIPRWEDSLKRCILKILEN